MPRYFIDLHDGANFAKDTVGFDVPDLDAVRARVHGMLLRYSRDLKSDVARQDLFLIVRNDVSKVVLRAHLALDFEPLENA